MPIKSKTADPKIQKESKTIRAVVLLRKVSLTISLFVKPWVNVAKIGSSPMGSIATKIMTKFSTNRFSMFAVY
jgi:hypothetical protein